MKAEKVKTKSGGFSHRFTMREVEFARMTDASEGLCCGCGQAQSGCEPDARKVRCEACDAPRVYGVEELIFMGNVVIK